MNMNTQLPRFDRQESMFRQGRDFQPMPGQLGQVSLRGVGPFARRPAFVGQQQTTTVQQAPAEPTAPPAPPPPPPSRPQGEDRPRPGLRLAWGRLKKVEAAELAAQLQQIVERMKAQNMPPGIVAQVQARLEQFSQKASDLATVEITEPEVQQMEAEILALEEAEATSESAATPLLVAAGALAAIGILVELLG